MRHSLLTGRMVPGSFDSLWSVWHKHLASFTPSLLIFVSLLQCPCSAYFLRIHLPNGASVYRKSAAKVGWKQSKVLSQASKDFPFLVTEGLPSGQSMAHGRWTSGGQWSVGLQLAGSSTMGHFFCPAARLSNSRTICVVAARENKLSSCPIFVSEFLLFSLGFKAKLEMIRQ